MKTETKIKLLKNAIRTTLNLITYEVEGETNYEMLQCYTTSAIIYSNLLNKVANELEMTSVESASLEGVLEAQVQILLEAKA